MKPEWTYMDGERERKRRERIGKIVSATWFCICGLIVAGYLWTEFFNAIPMEAFK